MVFAAPFEWNVARASRIPGRIEFKDGTVLMPSELVRTIVAQAVELPLVQVPPDASSDTLEAWDSLRRISGWPSSRQRITILVLLRS